MSQYKAAMARMLGGSGSEERRSNSRSSARPKIETGNEIADYLVENFDSLINFAIPVVWCLLFVLIMDREGLFNFWYMPFLGLFAAVLCNTVPIGGGVVYVPALSMLGVDIHLGVSFSVAVMTIGNGGLGFLRWLHKDATLIRWESFRYTVLPSSIGTFIAMVFFPPLDVTTVRTLFAYFCLLLACLVLAAVYRGGKIEQLISNDNIDSSATGCCGSNTNELIYRDTPDEEESGLLDTEKIYPARGNSGDNIVNSTEPSTQENIAEIVQLADNIPISFATPSQPVLSSRHDSHRVSVSDRHWYLIAFVSFLAGAFLVPNIGIGPALTTFIALQLVGYNAKAAIVTGIITGGWVSIVPFLLHWLWLNDVPFQLWIMVLPGVFYGAKFAPLVHDHVGLPKLFYSNNIN
eukprot:gene9448-11117_t